MTTIAWDGKTLAADRLADNGCKWPITKIFRLGASLVGGAGSSAHVLAMIEWLRAGGKPEDFPAAQRTEADWCPVVVIRLDGVLKYERTPFPIVHEAPFYACGSGRDFAIAAMHLGKNAREAVEIASLFDCGTGLGVDTLELGR